MVYKYVTTYADIKLRGMGLVVETTNSNNKLFYANRSFAYEKIGEYNKAVDDADIAITLDSSWSGGYWCRGIALMKLGNYFDAENAFKKVLQLDKTCIDAMRAIQHIRHRLDYRNIGSILLIGNLDSNTTALELSAIFSQYGKIHSVNIKSDTGKFALINYEGIANVDLAIQDQCGTMINNKVISVQRQSIPIEWITKPIM